MCRSVPSGRVGNAKDAIFRSNEHFRQAVGEREDCDVGELEHRLDRKLEKAERARIGVGQLRRFLEQLLQRRWDGEAVQVVQAGGPRSSNVCELRLALCCSQQLEHRHDSTREEAEQA